MDDLYRKTTRVSTRKYIHAQLSKFIEVDYFIKFILLFLSLYCFNYVYSSFLTPRGIVYSSFLDQHLNYLSALMTIILDISNLFAHFLGLNSYRVENMLKVSKGGGIFMAPECLGLGVLFFWVSFVIAHDSGWKKKLYWCILGILSISLINCIRIALVLVAANYRWPVLYLDHHSLFNIASYILIGILIYQYIRVDLRGKYRQEHIARL